MAELGDDPAYPIQQAPEEEPVAQVGKIADEWRSWMQEPGNRSSLMQFGIQLMQPIGLGQTVAGHFGQAIGAAGEAGDRVTAQELAERKATREEFTADSQAQLRASDAETRAVRAGAAVATAEAAGVRAAAAKQRAEHGVALTEAKVRETNEKVRRLQIEADREPDLAKKRALDADLATARTENQRAQAELRQKQTEQSDALLDIRRQQADTATTREERTGRQAERRLDQGDSRLELDRQKMEASKLKWTQMTPKEKADAYRDHQLLSPKPMSRDEFFRQMEPGAPAGAPPPTAGAKPPAATAPAGAATPVGQTKEFRQGTFEKIAPGPDSDQSTWQKVD